MRHTAVHWLTIFGVLILVRLLNTALHCAVQGDVPSNLVALGVARFKAHVDVMARLVLRFTCERMLRSSEKFVSLCNADQ